MNKTYSYNRTESLKRISIVSFVIVLISITIDMMDLDAPTMTGLFRDLLIGLVFGIPVLFLITYRFGLFESYTLINNGIEIKTVFKTDHLAWEDIKRIEVRAMQVFRFDEDMMLIYSKSNKLFRIHLTHLEDRQSLESSVKDKKEYFPVVYINRRGEVIK